MYQAGLILEGGGMRGIYTAGVLDYFLEKGVEFSSVYGVSAGSLNGANFVAKQKGRSYATFTDYIGDERYSGVKHLVKTGNIFNVDFMYNLIPNVLNPFDYETFKNNPAKFYAVVSNIVTGKPEYIHCTDMKKDMVALQASASLPLLSQPVKINGKKYLDGGMCDSIPLYKSLQDENKKNVVILTQHKGYDKQIESQLSFIRYTYKRYPNFIKAMELRHLMYNNQTKFVAQQQEKGNVFVIQPNQPVAISRLEKDKNKARALYDHGYLDGQYYYKAMIEYLEK